MTTTLDAPITTRKPASGDNSDICPPFKVLLHNDDKNTCEHVAKSLRETFGWKQEKAVEIMMEAHKKGLALCIVTNEEAAEHYRDMLRSFSLSSTMEEA